MKRKLSLFLAALMLLSYASVAAACGTPETPASETTLPAADSSTAPGPAEPAQTEPEFGFADYGGDTFTVYMRNSGAATYPALYIKGEDNGAICEEAALTRNLQIEEKFNLKFEFIESENVSSTLAADIKSGDPGYDMLVERRNSLAPKVTSGLMYDFNRLQVDFTRPWWDINCVDGYTVNGRLFLMANDVSIARFSNAYILYFNKRILTEYKLDDPYRLEAAGEWTLETFLKMVSGVSYVPADGSVGTYGLRELPTTCLR